MGRGVLTDKIQKIAKEHLGREIGIRELRLIPYIQYVMVNDQKIEPRKVNAEERTILSTLRKEGHIEGGMTGLAITKEYWDFMCEVLFYSYIAYREEDTNET